MPRMLFALLFLTCSTPATAQVFEVGVGISRGCVGDEGDSCNDEPGPMWATHGSVWLADRVEIGIRLGTLLLPDSGYAIARDDRFNVVDDPAIRQLPRIDVTVRDRRRRILSGDTIYHFGRGTMVRGLLGLGLGAARDRYVQACAPPGCERLMPTLSSPVGRNSTRLPNVTIIAGVSGRIGARLQVRGGIRLHNLAGENLSTSEFFTAAGYRFGRAFRSKS
jgi:hypothetical protein